MAVIHFAYTFDWDVHRNLQNILFEDDTIHLLKLQELAKSVVQNAKNKERLLSPFRYDDDWLDDPDRDQSQAGLWYSIYLAQFFKEVPSLTDNCFRGSHSVIRHLLPLAGWPEREVLDLLYGK